MGRTRAPKACKRCHQLRVKCDAVTKSMPCSRCEQDGARNCQLIESKRGRYPRKKALCQIKIESETPELKPVQVISPSASSHTGSSIGRSPQSSPGDTTNTNIKCDSPQGLPKTSFHTNDNELNWSSVLDQVLNKLRDRKTTISTSSITYLGESFLLLHLLEDDFKEDGRLRLHLAGPSSDRSPGTDDINIQSEEDDETAALRPLGVFSRCEPDIEWALIHYYFQLFHPLYPIVNKQDFLRQYSENEVPLVLLHSICFASCLFCPLSIILSGGFQNRSEAQAAFYKKAKTLFDHKYNKNKLVMVQTALLLSFHGGNPNDLWNAHFWISVAVSVAETLGMHRTITATSLTQKDKSLFKRIWWILVIRDSFVASLLGRPLRINCAQCDVEMLTFKDIEDSADNFVQGAYLLELTKLALIMRDIVQYRLNPWKSEDDYSSYNFASLEAKLIEWRASLPVILDWQTNLAYDNEIFSLALGMIYNHHLIYIHLPRCQTGFGSECEELLSDGKLDCAVRNIIKYASALVKQSKINMISHEAFSSIFAAEVILCSQMKYSHRMVAALARVNLELCQMILNQIVDFWDSSSWISHLVNNLIAKIDKELKRKDHQPDASVSGLVQPSSGLLNDNMDEVLSFIDDERDEDMPRQSTMLIF